MYLSIGAHHTLVWSPTLPHGHELTRAKNNITAKNRRGRVWANGLPFGVARAGMLPKALIVASIVLFVNNVVRLPK